MLHIPLLRKGRPYRSLDTTQVVHHRTREPFVEVSVPNVGLIRRDLRDQPFVRERIADVPASELLRICRRAAVHFVEDDLPLGEECLQSARDYVHQLSATTGMPFSLIRRNMEKISGVLAEMESVLAGLTRNLDLGILDNGQGETDGQALSFFPLADSLGVVLPSNSPGVHSLWVPAVALKTPLVVKPGSAEPWTPFRIIQALIRAGAPAEVFSYYPTGHEGAMEILRRCGRGMIFGDWTSTSAWQNDPRVEVHGPGYSKIVIGDDCVDEWESYLDVMVNSVADNGGRSCVNCSSIWATRNTTEIAEALAERLENIVPRAVDDEQAAIVPFPNPEVANRVSDTIDQELAHPGTRDVSASQRRTSRLVQWEGCTYLLPTIVQCDSPDLPLANREFLFPFASVVKARQEDLPDRLGPSLVVTLITADERLARRFLSCSGVSRLNLGAIATNQIVWNQPHEGNLFDHLYARRAFQKATVAS